MHIRAFGLRATIVLRDEFLSWKVLRDAKSMGTAALSYDSVEWIVHVLVCYRLLNWKMRGEILEIIKLIYRVKRKSNANNFKRIINL